jgi:rRNA-processing protein FCF1
MTKSDEVKFLIVDANIVIDYLDCDETLFILIKKHIGQVNLASPLLEEVKTLDLTSCHRLGIKIVDPTIEQLSWAADQEFSISFQDKICLILARDNNWALVTDDKALRKRCESEKITLIWGVELICLLCEAGGLHRDNARDIILVLHENNPLFIKKEIVNSALIRLGINKEME